MRYLRALLRVIQKYLAWNRRGWAALRSFTAVHDGMYTFLALWVLICVIAGLAT